MIGPIGQNGNPPWGRQHVAKQFNAFSNQHARQQRHASNVSARMCQARNYASLNRVGRDYHNREVTCCLLRRQRTGDVQCDDYINLKPDQLGRQLGRSIQLAFCRAKLKCNVLPLA